MSQAHVTNVLCKLTFPQERRCRVTSNRWDCMRNKILRSANVKYYYSYLFFCKINKGDLPLMYSCVFWCEFIDLVGFFGSCCLTPVTFFIIRSKGSTEKQPAVRTLSTRRRFATRKLNPSNHRFFWPEVNFYFYFIPKCCLLQSVFSLAGRLCSGGFYDVILPQIAQARNMSIGEHRHCCVTFEI